MAFENRVEVAAMQASASEDVQSLSSQNTAVEEQLARIISVARQVAIVAEELLRDVSHSNADGAPASRALAMAPRLLAATEQQLASVAAMLRQQ